MPVVELQMSKETFDSVPEEKWYQIGNELREKVIGIAHVAPNEVGLKINIWALSIKMEKIEVLVHLGSHFSHRTVERMMDQIHERFPTVFQMYGRHFPADFEIGIWPQSPEKSKYGSFVLNQTPELFPRTSTP